MYTGSKDVMWHDVNAWNHPFRGNDTRAFVSDNCATSIKQSNPLSTSVGVYRNITMKKKGIKEKEHK